MNRRVAVITGSLVLAEVARARSLGAMTQAAPLSADEVRTFVRAAHADLPAVQAALEARPALVNACQDWGAGDFETAIGAAGHMGRRDIAEALLAAGARPDLFTTIVMRELDVLRTHLRRRPSLVRTRGPHGLSFDAHAKSTGDVDVIKEVADIVAEARAQLGAPR